jgi:hypothetical protein
MERIRKEKQEQEEQDKSTLAELAEIQRLANEQYAEDMARKEQNYKIQTIVPQYGPGGPPRSVKEERQELTQFYQQYFSQHALPSKKKQTEQEQGQTKPTTEEATKTQTPSLETGYGYGYGEGYGHNGSVGVQSTDSASTTTSSQTQTPVQRQTQIRPPLQTGTTGSSIKRKPATLAINLNKTGTVSGTDAKNKADNAENSGTSNPSGTDSAAGPYGPWVSVTKKEENEEEEKKDEEEEGKESTTTTTTDSSSGPYGPWVPVEKTEEERETSYNIGNTLEKEEAGGTKGKRKIIKSAYGYINDDDSSDEDDEDLDEDEQQLPSPAITVKEEVTGPVVFKKRRTQPQANRNLRRKKSEGALTDTGS